MTTAGRTTGGTTIDGRTPVLVGVGQLSRRPDDPTTATEPADMMAEVARLAAADAKADALLGRVDTVQVVAPLSWRYADPGRLVAERLGISPRSTAVSSIGGNSPQLLVNRAALDILAGRLDVALVVGAEAMYTRRLARRDGVPLAWTPLADTAPGVEVIGDDRPGTNDVENAVGLLAPPLIYPLFENALRAAAGESIAAHQQKVAELWSRFSAVAARNPYAWSPGPKPAEEIREPSPDNRMIAFPYTKWMNANMQVDQAAGFLLCSLDAARAVGVPDDRLVFPLAGADGHDHWWVSSRWNLHESPAIRLAGAAALEAAGLTIDDVTHLDLYSCFPSAVQLGAAALGLPLDRELTVTGGLTFGGGPGNNYVSHSIAAMADRLRADPGSVGLVTALGWYATKHSVGLWSTTPPARGFAHRSVQAAVDALPARRYVSAEAVAGAVTVETYTVVYERDGSPVRAVAACLLPDGARGWAVSTDADVLAAMVTTEFCGRPATVRDGILHPA